MSRVTGLSVVDNQYVFVRGLGERYSNTTLVGFDAADDRAGQEGRAARSVPGGPARQRAGEQVVFARSIGGVRRRPGADSAAQVPEPRRPRFLLRLELLLERHRQVDSAERARQPRLASASTTARAQLPAGIPDNKIVRQGIYTPDVGYNPDQITRLRPPARRQSVAADHDRRRAGPELGRGVRQPLRQVRRRRQRDALLQGAVTSTSSARFYRIGDSADGSRGRQRLPDPDRHAEGAARRASPTSPISSAATTACRWRTSTATAAGTRAVSSRGRTPRTCSTTTTTACSSSRKG